MELNQKIIDVASNLMEIITKGYQWYIDTPEQSFELTPGAIWLINPDTKEWLLELNKIGVLYYQYKTYDTFSKYLNMGRSDFESFIKVWMEDVLKKGVVSTCTEGIAVTAEVEDVLKRGVSSTIPYKSNNSCGVEDVLKRGVVSIIRNEINWDDEIKDVLEKGVTTNVKYFAQDT